MVKCTKWSTYIKAHRVAYLNGPGILKQKRLLISCTKQNDLTKFFLIIKLFLRIIDNSSIFSKFEMFFLTFHCIKIRKVKKKEICTFLFNKIPKISCDNHSDKQVFF